MSVNVVNHKHPEPAQFFRHSFQTSLQQKLTDSMGIHDLGEEQRRSALHECLKSNTIDPARRDETEDFLEAILLFKTISNTQTVVIQENTDNPIIKQEDRSNSVSSDNTLVALPVAVSQRFTPSSPLPNLQDKSKATPHLQDTQGSPEEYLNTPEEENLLTPVVESLPDWAFQSDSSGLSSPPARVHTPEGWSNGVDTVSIYSSGHATPTMARLGSVCQFADANWSAFNALLDVARVADEECNDPDAYMTLEKVQVAGILIHLNDHHQSSFLNDPKNGPADFGTFTTPEGKGQTVTPAQTRELVLRRMGDQLRRTGMKLTTALGGLPVTPSSTIQHDHLFSPTCKTYQKKYFPQSPLSSHQRDRGYDSDITVDDPSWTRSDSDSDMPLPERKKQVIKPQYSGPPRFLLDPNRTDSIAMAAKNNHPGDLNDIPSILTASNSKSSFLVSYPLANHPTAGNPQQLEYSELNLVYPSNKTTKSHFGGGDGLWEEGRDTENNINRLKDLEQLRADRKVRDDKEMYEGLKGFKGKQRGWNGEHESDRQETLSSYHIEEERKAQEAYEKERAALKGKDPTPRKQRPEPTYNVMIKKETLAAKGKEVEEAYSERYAKVLQNGQDYDDYIGALKAQNHKDIMKRPWDHYQIKREALEEKKAMAKEEQRAKAEADSGSTLDSNQTLKDSKDLASKNLKRKEIAEDQRKTSRRKKVRL